MCVCVGTPAAVGFCAFYILLFSLKSNYYIQPLSADTSWLFFHSHV